MKKILFAEILILAALVIASVVVLVNLETPGPAVPAIQTDPPAILAEPSAIQTEPGITDTEPVPSTTLENQTAPTTEPGPTWMTLPQDRELLASQYFVYDVETDTFLTDSGNGATVYPASITKLFTCYVAMQYLEPETVLTVGDELDLVAWGSSVAGLAKGDQLTVAQLTEAMLLPSGNDAAYVLAVNAGRVICGDPNAGVYYAVETFMSRMNENAKAAGMAFTHFSNPDGIHSDDHYMSFTDLALLGKLSLENETILEMAQVAHDQVEFVYTATRVGEVDEDEPEIGQWKNTNALIDPESEYYCPYAVGLKTGQTPYAGSCLLSAFDYQGQKLIIGVFGCPETEDRFPDTLQLFNEAIGQ